MYEIDVTLVAVRRPELLARTLASFHNNLFSRVPVGRVFLNIDPLWGDEGDAAAVEGLVRAAFPAVEIEVTQPATASLTAALKYLWSRPRTDWFLHIEDDWALNIPIDPKRLSRQMDRKGVGQIRLSWWYPTKRFSRPVEFGTMPAFNRTEFARQAAALMDRSAHPERQMYNGANPGFSNWVSGWTPIYYGSIFTPAAITDLGKPWRLERGLGKSTHVAATSVPET